MDVKKVKELLNTYDWETIKIAFIASYAEDQANDKGITDEEKIINLADSIDCSGVIDEAFDDLGRGIERYLEDGNEEDEYDDEEEE